MDAGRVLMPEQPLGRTATDRYVQRSRASGDGYAVDRDELAEILRDSYERSGLALSLLTALQRTLPRSSGDDTEELKELLTNVIIMRTRLAGREEELVALLEQEADGDGVPVDEDLVRRWADGIARAYEHVQGDH